MKGNCYFIVILFLISSGFGFIDHGNYCLCGSKEDCQKAILSCNYIKTDKNIDNLEVIDKRNITIDCNNNKIRSIEIKNSNGKIMNCIFERGWICLSVDGNFNISKNQFRFCNTGIKINSGKNTTIKNNLFYKNQYALTLDAPVEKIYNNTFKSLRKNIYIPKCEENESLCEKFKGMEIINNYFAIYKNGSFVLEDLNIKNIIKDKSPKKEDPTKPKNKDANNNKKEQEQNNTLLLIIPIIIIGIIIFGVVLYKKKNKNEDDFEW